MHVRNPLAALARNGEAEVADMDYNPDYPQLFAQIMHLVDTGFKYYFTPGEQEELSAYSYQFENNNDEFDFLVKYVRKFPSKCQQKTTHTAAELLQKLKFFNQEYVVNKAAEIRMGKAMARRGFEYFMEHNHKVYYCYILNAEQAEYIAQHRNNSDYIDLNFDRDVPREVLIAGGNAKIADICKARELLNQAEGDFKEAQRLYDTYIKEDREIKFTNDNTLPF